MNIPQRLMSEANIQAEFYCACKQIGLNCSLEVSTPIGRLDAGLFSEDWSRLLAIVECKHTNDGKVKRTPQIERYKRIGVPVFGLARMDCISLAVKIKTQTYPGVALDAVLEMERRQRKPRRSRENGVLKPRFSTEDLDEMINFRP
jgi:hypothetical protein